MSAAADREGQTPAAPAATTAVGADGGGRRLHWGVSPRGRVVAIVAVVSAAAAGAAVGGALIQGRSAGGEVHGQTVTTTSEREPPALELALLDHDDREARALREAERLYETGDRQEAKRRFDALLAANPNSIEAAVGAAITAWPAGTLERLEALVRATPESATARLNFGLALVAAGRLQDARRQWRQAESVDPNSAAGLRAEDLLHPKMPPGRPQFVLEGELPAALVRLPFDRRLAALARRAQSGDVDDWLLYGSVLERVGRRLSAQRAYDRAVGVAPASLEAQTAAIVVRFDKDDPSGAFSRLGPLSGRHPRSGVARFHLGLMLLWLPSVAEAREQLRLVAQAEPRSFYAREAKRVLERLEDVE